MITFQGVRRKILVVDDDRRIVETISSALKERGFDLITAINGNEAIGKVRSELPELVLLDLNLPDMSGREVLKRIKEIREDIAVIVITGFGGEGVAIDLMKSGAMDFLSKPFKIALLLKSIDDTLTLRDAKIRDKGHEGSSSLEEFFPFLAHEIRTPLHAIEGAIAIIQRRIDLGDEILSHSVRIIHEEVQHLTDFVEACLDFVRHPVQSYFVKGQINEVISVAVNTIAYISEDLCRNIRVIYHLDPHLPEIPINYEEIRQAFLNLVKNGCESMPDGGEFIIETSLKTTGQEEFISIVLTDRGSGIRREDLKHLFRPFFTTKVRGSGLGLAICHRIIVERHKGKLSIESEEGKGTKIIVELPIHPDGDIHGERSS